MAKAIDVAAIAAEYGSRPVQCRACRMRSELLDIARQLRNIHGLPFNAISRALDGKFGEKIGSESLRKHFANHEDKAA